MAATVDDAAGHVDQAVIGRARTIVDPCLEGAQVAGSAHVIGLHVVQPVKEPREPLELRVLRMRAGGMGEE